MAARFSDLTIGNSWYTISLWTGGHEDQSCILFVTTTDSQEDQTVVGLRPADVTRLRDAMTAWLADRTEEETTSEHR